MFIINLFKIIFFVILFMLVYNIIRVLLFVKRNTDSGHIKSGRNDRGEKVSAKNGKTKVIELDEDQYRVE